MKNKENNKIDIMAEYRKLECEENFYTIVTNKLMSRMTTLKIMDVFTDESTQISDYEFYWLVKTYNHLIVEIGRAHV